MDTVKVLPLAAEHLSGVAELERLCFSEPWSEGALSLLTEPSGFGGVILSEDGQVIACGGMTTVLDEGSVTNIATHPDFRRRGLGREIVGYLLRTARQRQIMSVFLEVRESNLAARELYLSAGFEACGIRKNFYRYPTENAVQMVWRAP